MELAFTIEILAVKNEAWRAFTNKKPKSEITKQISQRDE